MTTADPQTLNEITFSDALNFVKDTPDSTIAATVTSPPGWRKRRQLPDDHPLSIFEMGQEDTLAEYLDGMKLVFAEAFRATKPGGSLWVHLPDTRATADMLDTPEKRAALGGITEGEPIGVPHELTKALRSLGWRLVSEIVWAKTNDNHRSATLRPSDSHEKILLFAKSEKFYFDWYAAQEVAATGNTFALRRGRDVWTGSNESVRGHVILADLKEDGLHLERDADCEVHGDNPVVSAGSLFDASSGPASCSCRPLPPDVYAVTPSYIAARAIAAGSPEYCCSGCGAPWERIVKDCDPLQKSKTKSTVLMSAGYTKTCRCKSLGNPQRSLICDPFAGTGTTLMAAQVLSRNFIGSDIDPDCVAKLGPARLAMRR